MATRLLPPADSPAEFRGARAVPDEVWIAALRELLPRHGLKLTTVTKFADGEFPAFGLGAEYVVKLIPKIWVDVARRERAALDLASQRSDVVPRVTATGECEDWCYLVMTRRPGTPLNECWARLDADTRTAIATDVGCWLAHLHAMPITAAAEIETDHWLEFVRKQSAAWPGRNDVAALDPRLRMTGPDYLSRVLNSHAADRLVFLHGDLAPENVLVSEANDGWRITGVLDFGNARVGDPVFDLTAPTVLLAPGNHDVITAFCAGYGLAPRECDALRPVLMGYTLVHNRADLGACLRLLPGLSAASAWEAVAAAFWPSATG